MLQKNTSFRVEKLGLDNFNFISYQLLHSLRKKVDNVIKNNINHSAKKVKLSYLS
jgi:hypothetical protein